MIDVKGKTCLYEGCRVRPCYNVEGEPNPLYCLAHKDPYMVNVKDKILCITLGCKTRANYNAEGEIKPLYCSDHKLESMINVKDRTCLHEGCRIRPCFNAEGEMRPLYCSTHKLENMVNVKDKLCVHEGCKIRANYNVEEEIKPLYCSQHKLESMINVKSKKCLYEGCQIIPCYNLPNETNPLYCTQHKLENMVNVKDKICIYEGCCVRANYNLPEETSGLYCASHKSESMVNVKSKTCQSEWCFTHVKNKYDGYCLFCYINLFPDKPVTRNYKTKEYSVVEFVKNKCPNHNWISDKTISDGCSKRRPDLLLDLGYQVVIVEVDENQHTDYDCSCENKRIMELSQDVGHRPIVFIRFNPDEYRVDNKKVTSCWGINKNGICAVKKSKQAEWTNRLNSLEEQIEYWSNPSNRTNKTIEVVQLFYDT